MSNITEEERNYAERILLKETEGIDSKNYKSEWKKLNGRHQVRIYDEVRTTPFIYVEEHQLATIREKLESEQRIWAAQLRKQ